jgi:hypothetical protein
MHHRRSPFPSSRRAWVRPLLWAPLIAALAATSFGATEPGLLQRLLTPGEFHRAGLDRLTPEELEFLNARLAATGVSARQAEPRSPSEETAPLAPPSPQLPQGEAAFGNEQQLHLQAERLQRVPSSIRSRIRGAFSGWEGRTVFSLENGQVWRQVDGARFSVNLVDPTVIIEKGVLGAFYLRVDGYGSRVKVKRVK